MTIIVKPSQVNDIFNNVEGAYTEIVEPFAAAQFVGYDENGLPIFAESQTVKSMNFRAVVLNDGIHIQSDDQELLALIEAYLEGDD